MTHGTYLKKLPCLCFYTLGCINDHNCRIRRHKCTVRIFREVLMSRRIQNVDTISVIIKLENRRSDGNTSFLLNLHPVGYGMSGCCLTLYTSRLINRASIQEKLLCQCCLTGIRVGNNSKCSSLFNLFLHFICYL